MTLSSDRSERCLFYLTQTKVGFDDINQRRLCPCATAPCCQVLLASLRHGLGGSGGSLSFESSLVDRGSRRLFNKDPCQRAKRLASLLSSHTLVPARKRARAQAANPDMLAAQGFGGVVRVFE